jgi:hypothetical protein
VKWLAGATGTLENADLLKEVMICDGCCIGYEDSQKESIHHQ